MPVEMIELDLLRREHPFCRRLISGILEFLYDLSKLLVFFTLDCQSCKVECDFYSHVLKVLA